MSVSMKAPFSLDGGRVSTTSSSAVQVEQKIINVLTTATLERVGLPDYGGNVNSLVFESLDTLAFEDFKVDLGLEVARSVTGVSIIDIIVNTRDVLAEITVIYRLPLSSAQQFTFRLASPGELNEETPL